MSKAFEASQLVNTRGRRNLFHNGDFIIQQRGSAWAPTDGQTLNTLDRWTVYTQGSGVTVARGTAAGYGRHTLEVTGAAGNTGTNVGQKMESKNAAVLVGKDVTLSFWIYLPASRSVTTLFRYADSVDNFASLTTVGGTSYGTLAAGWHRIEETFTNCPSGCANGVRVQVIVDGHTSGTYKFAQMQFELGASASEFESRQFNEELTDCQRYFEKSYAHGTSPGTAGAGGAHQAGILTAALLHSGSIQFNTAKRITPTITLYSEYNNSITGVISEYSLASVFQANRTGAATGASDKGFWAYSNTGSFNTTAGNYARVHWTADAEL